MIAERDNDRVEVERESRLLIGAKARVWASEGWDVIVIDSEGRTYDAADFDEIVA